MNEGPTEDIRQFWNEQATTLGTDPRATTPDFWLRELEIANISRVLSDGRPASTVLDIGCGNGYSTLHLARLHPEAHFVGGDFASSMVAQANEALEAEPVDVASRVQFREMDVCELDELGAYGTVISDRCLINLPSWARQQEAVDRIAGSLVQGGSYVAVENFAGAHDNFNAERVAAGLDPIPVRWHNLYLEEAAFLDHCGRHFELVESVPLSSTYYLATRIVYSKLCQMEGVEPSYDHPIHEIATGLPMLGDFGPIKLFHLRKR